MHTEIKTIGLQEYICELTNNLVMDDFIIHEYNGNSCYICKIIHIGGGMFQYKVVNKENTVGWDTFHSKATIPIFKNSSITTVTNKLFYKIIGIGFETN